MLTISTLSNLFIWFWDWTLNWQQIHVQIALHVHELQYFLTEFWHISIIQNFASILHTFSFLFQFKEPLFCTLFVSFYFKLKIRNKILKPYTKSPKFQLIQMILWLNAKLTTIKWLPTCAWRTVIHTIYKCHFLKYNTWKFIAITTYCIKSPCTVYCLYVSLFVCRPNSGPVS